MLSRNGTRQPLKDFREKRQAANGSGSGSHRDATTSSDPPDAPYRLCDACRQVPFGLNASKLWQDAWKRSDSVQGALSLDYEKPAQEIKSGALQRCKWCLMIASAVLLALNLDVAIAQLNDESGSGSDGDEGESVKDDVSGDEAGEESDSDTKKTRHKEETASDNSKLPNEHDVLDVFGRCEISMRFLNSHKSVGTPGQFNRLEILAEVYPLPGQPESIGLIGHKCIEIELEILPSGKFHPVKEKYVLTSPRRCKNLGISRRSTVRRA